MLDHSLDHEVAGNFFEPKTARPTKFQSLVSGVLGAQKAIKQYVQKGKRTRLARTPGAGAAPSASCAGGEGDAVQQPRRSTRTPVAGNALSSYAKEARERSARAHSVCSRSRTAEAWEDQSRSVVATPRSSNEARASEVRARLAQLRAKVSALKEKTQALENKCRDYTAQKEGAAVDAPAAAADTGSADADATDTTDTTARASNGSGTESGRSTMTHTAPSSSVHAIEVAAASRRRRSGSSSSTSSAATVVLSRRVSTVSCSAWDEDDVCVAGDGYVSDLEPISRHNTPLPSAMRSLIAAGGEEGSRKHTLRAETWLTFSSFGTAGSVRTRAAHGSGRRSRAPSNSDSLLGDGDDVLSMFDLKQQRSMRSVRRSVRKTSLHSGQVRLPSTHTGPATDAAIGEEDILG